MMNTLIAFSIAATSLFAVSPLLAQDVQKPSPVALPVVHTDAEELPVDVLPTTPEIRYVGRFDFADTNGPRCSWSASAVRLEMHGSALNVKLNESGDGNRYEVVVDGKPTAVLWPLSGEHLYRVFDALDDGNHTVLLVKRTESFAGTSQFRGFQLSKGGSLLKATNTPSHRIEVVGDSISCAYGNEAASEKVHFSAETENAYLSYGAIAARAFNADFVCLAWSGRTMWPQNTMDEIYGRTIATEDKSQWDFTKWTPDAVVITLGTNDFAKGTPDHTGWVAGYRAFIARVRKNYPKAAIYCATSPMMWGDGASTIKTFLQEIVTAEQAAGDKNVRLLEFEQQKIENGLGADWHPSVKTHQIMADKLSGVLAHDLDWKVSVPGKQDAGQ